MADNILLNSKKQLHKALDISTATARQVKEHFSHVFKETNISDEQLDSMSAADFLVMAGKASEEDLKMPGPPPAMSQEEVAGLRKSLRNAHKRRMAAYDNAKDSYDSRVNALLLNLETDEKRLASEERKRAKEEQERRNHEKREPQRVRLRGALIDEPAIKACLEAIKAAKTKEARLNEIDQLYTTAAFILLKDEDISEELSGQYKNTADYLKTVDGVRLSAVEIEDEDLFASTMTTLDTFEKKFKTLDKRNLIARIKRFELSDVFDEELKDFKNEIDQAISKEEDDISEYTDTVIANWGGFEASAPALFGLERDTELEDPTIYVTEDRFKAYMTTEKRVQYKKDLKLLMSETGYTEDEARTVLMLQKRNEFWEKTNKECSERTIQGQVVESAPKEAFEKGVSSFSRYVPASLGEKLVKESKGFLCAIPATANPSIVLLRPSLPETITLKAKDGKPEKKIPLRRYWNTYMKTIGRLLFDEKNNLKENALESALKIDYTLTDSDQDERGGEAFRSVILPEMASLLKANGKIKEEQAKAEAAEICDSLQRLFSDVHVRGEISAANAINALQDLDKLDEKALTDEAMTLEIGGRKLTKEEIDEALLSLKSDSVRAKIQFQKLRDLDIESKETPIFNTCSGNAFFIQDLQHYITGEKRPMLEYHLIDYLSEKDNRLPVMEKILNNFENLKHQVPRSALRGHGYKDIETAWKDLNELYKKLKETPDDFNEDDQERYIHVALLFTKYEFHEGANIISKPEESWTTEGFAAETTQYLVEPFTMNGAVGHYTGAPEYNKALESQSEDPDGFFQACARKGMKDYYNMDDPIASDRASSVKVMVKDLIIKQQREKGAISGV